MCYIKYIYVSELHYTQTHGGPQGTHHTLLLKAAGPFHSGKITNEKHVLFLMIEKVNTHVTTPCLNDDVRFEFPRQLR